jgi:Trk K+ transport system NAD-binding subunit
MDNWWRRIALSVLTFFGVVTGYAVVYRWGMATFEGETVSHVRAFQVVVEALTTAGFGGDAPWSSAVMSGFVVVMNLSGVLLMFLALPVVVIPLLKQAVETDPPTTTDLVDHVVICSNSTHGEVLRDELEAVGVPYLFVESDPEDAKELVEAGIDVICGDPEHLDTFRAANAAAARAVVADVDDDTNPIVTLSAKEIDEDLPVVSVVTDRDVMMYNRSAGADTLVRPRQVLGTGLATKAAAAFPERFRNTLSVGDDVEITELVVEADSALVGQTIAGTDVFDGADALVVGAWKAGRFVASPDPTEPIDENTTLLVTGHHDDLAELRSRTVSPSVDRPSRVVVCGYGVVGRTVADVCQARGTETCVVDAVEGDDVDVVGDVTDPEVLSAADVEDASAVVIALDDDTQAVYATLVLTWMAPDVEVIARANDPDNVWKLYNSGADYVLSLQTVTGRMLASHLIEGETILTPGMQFDLVRTDAPALAGRSLGEVDVRERTGCTVVAVERDGTLESGLGPEFVVEADDTLVVAGDDDATARFLELGH